MTSDEARVLEAYLDEDDGVYTVIDSGDWVDDGKYQYQQTVIRDKSTDRYFAVSQSRSGSYYSDFEYDDPEICEVSPVEYTAIRWEYVK